MRDRYTTPPSSPIFTSPPHTPHLLTSHSPHTFSHPLLTPHLQHMVENLRGELTVFDSDQHQFSLRDSEVLQSIVEALNLSSSQVGRGIPQTILIPRPSPFLVQTNSILIPRPSPFLVQTNSILIPYTQYSHSQTTTHFHLPFSTSSSCSLFHPPPSLVLSFLSPPLFPHSIPNVSWE